MGSGVKTWVLKLPRQAFYPLSHIPSPVFYFKNFRGCLRVCNIHLWLIRVHFQILSCLTGNASSLYQFPVPPFHPFSQRWHSFTLPKARKQNTFPFKCSGVRATKGKKKKKKSLFFSFSWFLLCFPALFFFFLSSSSFFFLWGFEFLIRAIFKIFPRFPQGRSAGSNWH